MVHEIYACSGASKFREYTGQFEPARIHWSVMGTRPRTHRKKKETSVQCI